MKISIDTKEDSHEEIRKAIKMLQNIVGDEGDLANNLNQGSQASPIANIFGDTAVSSETAPASEANQETTQQETAEETPQSTEDLFAELFSEEELKKMDVKKESEEEEESEEEIKHKSKDKKHEIEFY